MADKFLGYEGMCRLVGKRHAECWFDNYQIGTDSFAEERQAVLQIVKNYATELSTAADRTFRKNLILMGTCGTGKDHLAISVLRVAMGAWRTGKYLRGSELMALCRRAMQDECDEVPHELLNTPFLVISDIEPNPNQVSSFEERAILRLVDHRYMHLLPTVVTTNLESYDEVASLIGKRAASRLFEDAVIVVMAGWPDFRASGGAI